MVLVLITGFFVMRESRLAPTDEVDKVFVDWLAANTARNLPSPPCILTEVNDSSLEDKHAWPWSPLDFALFLQAVTEFEPKVIAIEPVLNWDNQSKSKGQSRQAQYERSLDEYILRAKSIVLGSQLGFPLDPDVVPPLQPAPFFRGVRGDVSRVTHYTAIEDQPKEEYRSAPMLALGFVNLPARPGVTRTMPLVFSYQGEVVPSFALQAVMLYLGLTTDDVTVDLGSTISLGNRLTIPIDATGAMRVDFGAPLTRFGFDDLLLAVEQVRNGRPPVVPAAALKGKIVLLARTDKASQTLRFPSRRDGSSGELFADGIATILNKAFIHRVSPVFDVALILLMTVAGYFVMRWSLERIILSSLLAFIFYLLISMTVFANWFVWFPVLLPASLFLVLMLLRLLTPKLSHGA